MTHAQGEKIVKGLQKEFLLAIEEHPILFQLSPDDFNDLRRRVFKGTFEAFRLGVVGIEKQRTALWAYFFGWLENHRAILTLDPEVKMEVTEMCFRSALEAYRVGAMVAVQRLGDLPE